MRKALVLLAATASAVAAAAVAQQHMLRHLDPRDVAEAREDNAALVQELGGAETGQRAAYVASVGRRVGAYSGLDDPVQALHFTLLNSAVENAFSLPGGYVYATRQLMTVMDDESELAFALGHEVGHIAANHAHLREAYAQRSADALGVFAGILGNVFGDTALLERAKLNLLSFSREQEYEADELGLRYMISAGYDPAGAPALLAALSRESALQARVQGRTNRQIPEWASTHPLNENRMQQTLQWARQSGRLGRGVRNRDKFLSELEGTYVDDDPAQGIIDGPVFTHPDLRIQFRVPPGYLMSNGTFAVTISGSAGKAQFSGGSYSGSLDRFILNAYEALTDGQIDFGVPQPRRTTINGMPAAYTTARVSTSSGPVDVSVVAYRWDSSHVYDFVMLTPGGYGMAPFASMVNSLRRISPQEAAAIRPRVIHVVTVGAGDTVQSLASRMAYRTFKLDRFLTLNGLSSGSRLVPGQKVKLVVYGARRS